MIASLVLATALAQTPPLAPPEGDSYRPPQKMAEEPLAPEQEAHVQRLGKTLRCAVCQGRFARPGRPRWFAGWPPGGP